MNTFYTAGIAPSQHWEEAIVLYMLQPPTRALDGLPPRVHGQRSFMCTCANKSYREEAAKHNLGTKLVNSFSC